MKEMPLTNYEKSNMFDVLVGAKQEAPNRERLIAETQIEEEKTSAHFSFQDLDLANIIWVV